jgi:hypothetical protein
LQTTVISGRDLDDPSSFLKTRILLPGSPIGLLAFHRTCVRKDRALIEAQKIVEPRIPIAQEDLFPPSCLILGKIEEHHHGNIL